MGLDRSCDGAGRRPAHARHRLPHRARDARHPGNREPPRACADPAAGGHHERRLPARRARAAAILAGREGDPPAQTEEPLPVPHFPFDDLVVLDRGGGSPQPTPPSPRPPRGFPISPRLDDLVVRDLEPLQPPVDPPQWLDAGTLVLTDDDERRALVIPFDLSARTPLPLAGPTLRLRLQLDRERYRSAAPDPAARAQATVVRTVTW